VIMRRTALLIAVTLAVAGHAQEPPAKVEPLHFHHVHLNSTNPPVAAEYYIKPFALSATKTTFNGLDAVKTGNIYLLFTKVAATPQNDVDVFPKMRVLGLAFGTGRRERGHGPEHLPSKRCDGGRTATQNRKRASTRYAKR